jgi:hypothetical protein
MDNLIRYEHKKLPLRLMHHCYRICCIVVTEGAVSLWFFVTFGGSEKYC